MSQVGTLAWNSVLINLCLPLAQFSTELPRHHFSCEDEPKNTNCLNHAADFLLSALNIHVSGACGPHRTQPIDCFHPLHHNYRITAPRKPTSFDACMQTALPGGVARNVLSNATRTGQAIVYDRDLVVTWRLPDVLSAYHVFFLEKAFESALGQETMLVAVKAFLDSNPTFCEDSSSPRIYLLLTLRSLSE